MPGLARAGTLRNGVVFHEVFARSSRYPGAGGPEGPGGAGNLTLRPESTEAFRPPRLQTSSRRCGP
jgi:hypothetical protein